MALVAREIAEQLVRRSKTDAEVQAVISTAGGLDVTACEAAGLAHDLGHPPFGHIGEVVLNRLLRKHGVEDGFEGNAQSFRIVTRLDSRRIADETVAGLSLTALTRAAILKYPWLCKDEYLVDGAEAESAMRRPPKFGAYRDDQHEFEQVTNTILVPAGPRRQTLEASIMDLADDITYAVHDLEDFHQQDAIDFVSVLSSLDQAINFFDKGTALPHEEHSNPFVAAAADLHATYADFYDQNEFAAELNSLITLIKEDGHLTYRYTGALKEATQLQSGLSRILGRFFQAIQVTAKEPWHQGPLVYLSKPEWHLMQAMKAVTRRYTVQTTQVGMIQQAEKATLTSLFNGLANWLSAGPRRGELPQLLVDYIIWSFDKIPAYGEKLQAEHYRAIADYICTLSDEECALRAKWLTGQQIPTMSTRF